MKLSNKGFTLIELLAVIAMISLVSSISIYFASDVIRKSREKSYEVTVRNIESKASNYLVENGNRLFYLSNGSNKEYQCITVKNLVDYGYLSNDVTKSKVSDNQNVKLDDYIYVERDEKNKTVEKSNYIYVSDYIYDSICSKAVKAIGDVSFAVEPDINEWSKYKDITITYKLKNLNDLNSLSNYSFNYNYNAANQLLSSEGNTKVVRATEDGNMNADIKYITDNGSVASNSIQVGKIDNIGPTVTSSYNGGSTVNGSVTIPLTLSDIGSGVNYSTFDKNDIVVKIGDKNVTSSCTLSNNGSGKYNLTITDAIDNGTVTLTIAEGKFFDNVENGNKEIKLTPSVVFNNKFNLVYNCTYNGGSGGATTSYTVGTAVSLTQTCTKNDYEFIGWNISSGATSNLSSYTMPSSNQTLYAIYKKSEKKYILTIYYNSNNTMGGQTVSNSKSTCTIAAVYNNATQETSCNASISSAVRNSKGKYNNAYAGLAGYINSMTVSISKDKTSMTISNNATYYSIYSSSITRYYYNNGWKNDTIYKNQWFTSQSSMSDTVLASSETNMTNISTTTGPGSSSFSGFAESATATTSKYSSVSAAASTTASSIYSIYQMNINYQKGSNVSSIGSTSGSCKVIKDKTNCNVTTPSITPNTGYNSVGWSKTNGATTGTAGGSQLTLSAVSNTYYANALDKTPPTLSISPMSGAYCGKESLISQCADNGSGVSSLKMYDCDWPTTGVDNGSGVFVASDKLAYCPNCWRGTYAVCYDKAGNQTVVNADLYSCSCGGGGGGGTTTPTNPPIIVDPPTPVTPPAGCKCHDPNRANKKCLTGRYNSQGYWCKDSVCCA